MVTDILISGEFPFKNNDIFNKQKRAIPHTKSVCTFYIFLNFIIKFGDKMNTTVQ